VADNATRAVGAGDHILVKPQVQVFSHWTIQVLNKSPLYATIQPAQNANLSIALLDSNIILQNRFAGSVGQQWVLMIPNERLGFQR